MSPFLHPGLAWAAFALASIPIIIHLLNRQRQRRLDWAAMEFLLKALKRTRRRVRLEQLILLACRVLLASLLALMLARPLLSDRDFGWLASALKSEDKTFILDDSLSMGRREAAGTVLDRATDALVGELSALARRGTSDRVTIVRASRPNVPLARGAFVDTERAAQLETTLRGASPTAARMDLPRILSDVAAQGAASTAESGARPRSVSILTDLRASDWTDGAGGASASLAAALARLTEESENPARIVVYEVGSDDTANLSVDEVQIESRPTIDIPAQIRVTVRNHGALPVRDLRVRMTFSPVASAADAKGEDPDAGAATALAPPIPEIGPGETATATISSTFRSAGAYRARASVSGSDDPLPADNELAFVIDVAESTRILIVSGEPSGDSWDDETHFLALALDPGGDANSGLEPVIVVEDSLPTGRLDEFGAVFLANVYSLPEDFLRRLGTYVRDGGSLVIFPGDQVNADVYDRDLGLGAGPPDEQHPARGLLPARLGALEGGEDAAIGLEPSYDHPFFEFLRDGGEPYVADVSFRRAFALEPFPDTQVLARLSGEVSSPALVERAAGAGRVLLFASTADREWNDWPRNVTYLMVLQRMIDLVGRGGGGVGQRLAGERIDVPVDISEYANEARLRPPDWPRTPESTLRAAPRAEVAGEFQFTVDSATTLSPGHALLALRRRGATDDEWRAVAIRSDRRESRLERIDPDRLAELYPDAEIRVVRDAARFSEAGRGDFEIADVLLGLIVLLLFVEGALACRFARHGENEGASALLGAARRGGRR